MSSIAVRNDIWYPHFVCWQPFLKKAHGLPIVCAFPSDSATASCSSFCWYWGLSLLMLTIEWGPRRPFPLMVSPSWSCNPKRIADSPASWASYPAICTLVSLILCNASWLCNNSPISLLALSGTQYSICRQRGWVGTASMQRLNHTYAPLSKDESPKSYFSFPSTTPVVKLLPSSGRNHWPPCHPPCPQRYPTA